MNLDEKSYWNDIEDTLAKIYELLIESRTKANEHLGFDSLERLMSVIFEVTGGIFAEWIDYIYNSMPIAKSERYVEIFENACFVNFNYTKTLEDIYSQNEEKILYIHGKLEQVFVKQSKLGNYSDKADNNIVHNNIEFGAADLRINKALNKTRVSDINDLVEYGSAATKKMNDKLGILNDFISKKSINQVVVIGHSLHGDDEFYFKEILMLKYRNIPWRIYYYDDYDYKVKKDFIQKYGIGDTQLIKF